MSSSGSGLSSLIPSGPFTKRFNVSKMPELEDIPETKEKDIRESNASIEIESTTSSPRIGTALGIELDNDKRQNRTPQPGDLLFLPPIDDLPSPTTFGPGAQYQAVQIRYSSAKGMSRISVRAAPESSNIQTISSPIPLPGDLSSMPPPSYQASIPVIPPPPDFQPISAPHPSPIPQPTPSPASTIPSTAPRISQISQSSASIRTSTTSQDGDGDRLSAVNTSRAHSYATTPPDTPSTTQQKKSSQTKPLPSTSASWPLPAPAKRSPYPSPSPAYSPYFDSPRGSGPSLNEQSRFSWHVSNSDRCRNWFTRWFVEWWLLEILSWCFSAICMVIITVVLLKYDGKDLPKWKIGLTLNAFISIFSGFAKSALLLPTAEALGQLKWNWFRKDERRMMDFEVLDSASRGPWGSFMLLTRTKGITLASVGAAIILLSLPLDLFFQQVVSYPTIWVQNGTASVQRSVAYNPAAARNYFNNSLTLLQDLEMQASMTAYLWGQVCGACQEMPKLLELGCSDTSGDWLSTVSASTGKVPNITACGYFWRPPGNALPILMTGYRVNTTTGAVGEGLGMRMLPLTDLLTRKPVFPGGSINFQSVQNPIADFLVAGLEGGAASAFRNATPVVHECELHWCVKTFSVSSSQGVLAEGEAAAPLALSTNDAESPWSNPTDYKPNFTLTLQDAHAPGGFATFGLSNVTARQTVQIWDNYLPSTLITPGEAGPQFLKWLWRAAAPQMFKQVRDPWLPPQNVTRYIGDIARAMTNNVRRTVNDGEGEAATVAGTAWSQRTLVHIRWQWIILPVVLLGSSLVFLVATVMRSRRDKDSIGVWKTSALAVLFNGIGEDVQRNVGGQQVRLGQVRKKAREMKVKLEE